MIIRKFLTIGLVLLTTAYSMHSHAQLPVDPSVIHGHATIHTTGDHVTVINAPNTILNWQSFSIGIDNSVYFQQHDAASMVLNRVTGNDPSNILGHLGSNGHIWLINPHGVLFGDHARIDAAGLMASTLDMTTLDFLSRRYHFNATDNLGQVRNQGEIRTSMGGQVWLLGNQVQNDGLILTPGGQTVLAAGKSIELVDSGTPNLIVQVKAPENQTVNLGSLVAPGGKIDLHGSIVNQEGIVRADSIGTDATGQVVLKADQVVLAANSQTVAEQGAVRMEAESTLNNWGEINARNIALTANSILQQGQMKSQGGQIDLTARSSTYLSGTVDVSNTQGTGGDIRLATDKLEGMAGGQLRADGEQGGHIRVTGNGMVGFSSSLSAVGSKQGGIIEVTGDQLYLLNADVNASGGKQGGTVHLGGGWQGSGDLPHAREVLIGTGSEVKTNGGIGSTAKGGEIAVWSTQSSEHYGSLEAKDGGRIELSSKDVVKQTGSIQAGMGGNILLDPKNLIISDAPPDSLTLARKFTLGSQNSSGLTLQNADQFGTSVALEGDLLAIGARRDDTGGVDSGAVYLFKGASGEDFSGLTLSSKLASGQGAQNMANLAAGSSFGTSVALNAGRLAVGAELESTGSREHGAVYLFSGAGSDFSGLKLNRTLTSAIGASNMPPLSAGDNFGSSVGLDGDKLVVGARSDDTSGAVHLFANAGADFSGLSWKGKISSNAGALGMTGLNANDNFGIAVALDGDQLAVGSNQDDAGGVNSGAVHLFTNVGTDFTNVAWKGRLTSGTGAANMPALAAENRFGRAIALEGDLLVVGSRADDTGGTSGVNSDRGAAFLFTGASSGFSNLSYVKKLASGEGAGNMPVLADGDHFGSALALDRGRLIVGADTDSTVGDDQGAAYLFTGGGTNFSGLKLGDKLVSGSLGSSSPSPVLNNQDQFGTSVALEGDLLAIGARRDDTGGVDSGAVYLFKGASGEDFSGLTLSSKLASGQGAQNMANLAAGSSFGTSVALNAGRLAVGAELESTGSREHGAVYLFSGAGSDFSGLKLNRTLTSAIGASNMPPLSAGDNFGSSVGLDGDKLVVGARSDDTSGAVHLFANAGADFSGLSWKGKISSNAGALGMTGLNANDNFGIAVALDGDQLAVGSNQDDAGGVNSGAVHLFTNVGTDFTNVAWKGRLTSGTGAANMPALAAENRFGRAIALEGDLLVVGSRADDTGGTSGVNSDRGAAFLFTGASSGFSNLSYVKKLASGEGAGNMPVLADGDHFGSALALDRGRLIVGADTDSTVGDDQGAAYLFTGGGTNFSGLKLGDKLVSGSLGSSSPSPVLNNQDQFGTSVALEGDLLAIGARRDDTGGVDSGAVYLFKGASGEDFSGLTLSSKLASGQGAQNMANLAAGSSFGTSVALNAGRLAVGAELESTGSREHGAVYLFSGAGSDFSGLKLNRTLTSAIGASNMPPLSAGDNFGSSVGLDGDKLVVGARSDDTSGAVHLFANAGADFSGLSWKGKISSNAGALGMTGLNANDNFGIAVALDGDQLAVGSNQDDAGGVNSGAVHLFTNVGTDFTNVAWKGRLTSGTGAANMPALAAENRFGRAIALEGDLLVVGSRADDTGGTSGVNSDRGAAFLFTGASSGFSNLSYVKKLASGEGAGNMPVLADGDHFGSALALDRGRLIVGADTDSTVGDDQGAAYLFTGGGTNFSGLKLGDKLVSGSLGSSSPSPVLNNQDQFGTSVALEGDLLAIGARRDDTGGVDSGAVYLFKGASGEDFSGLTLSSKLASGQGAQNMANLAAGSSFGTSVALNAGRLAVGAELESTGSREHGAVYLFSGAGSDFSGLKLNRTLTSAIGASNMPPLSAGDNFGSSVGLDGDKLVVGARSDDTSGAVHLFANAGADFSGLSWKGKISSNAGALGMTGLNANDNFGIAVALDGDQLAVGSNQDDAGGVNSGAVHLFTNVGTDFTNVAWKGRLTSGTGAANMPALAAENRFGRAIALEGDLLVVGSRVDDTGGTSGVNSDRGAAFLFTGASSGFSNLSYVKKLASGEGAGNMPALADGDHFGTALALDRGRLAVGADGSETAAGAVYFFNGALQSEIITDVTDATFGDNPSGDSYISSGTLVAMLNGGNTVTLQANNDITVQSDITVSQRNGAGGIILRAGRNINLDANVVTNNADFTAIAGDKEANSAYTDAGTPAITISEKANLNAGSGKIVLAVNAVDGIFTNLRGRDAITVSDAGQWLIYAANPSTSTEGFAEYQKHYNQGFDGVVPQYASSGNWFLYSVAPVLQVTPAGRTLNAGESIPSSFDYRLSGFIDNDNAASAVDSGNAAEFSVKNAGSAGSHDVAYSKGLSSHLGYQFVDDASSNNELTVKDGPLLPGKSDPGKGDTSSPVVKQNTVDTSIQAVNTASASSRPAISPVAEGKVVDASTTDSASSSSVALFDRLNVAKMNLLDLQQLIQQRRDYKNELFSDANSKLNFDPKLSDIPICNSLAEVDSGLCRISETQYRDMKVVKESLFNKNEYKIKVARLPQIKRKIIVLFGIDNYNDHTIPVLNNAIYDAEVIGELFNTKLGYDVRIVRNATKADFIRTFNQLSLELEADDSVVIYYAGHGYKNEKTGNGFWIPSDASAKDPGSWISNTNISEMLGNIYSKQVVMISDSCYSGFFTKEQKIKTSNLAIQPDEILVKRSVVVMSSGSDEPVADDGRGGHSIFAWSLMQALDNIDNWKAGANIFEQIQNDVFKRFPQKPQYGAIISAGHQEGGDYLFEFRQLEKNAHSEMKH